MLNTNGAYYKLFLATSLSLLMMISGVPAQSTAVRAQQSAAKKGVIFKIPQGYMPMDFPQQKGVLMLHPKKPAGMFIIYPKEGQKAEDLIAAVRPILAKMFIHDSKAELRWSETALPAHQGITGEAGKLMLTSDEKKGVQIAAYTRDVEGQEVVYGYFAMKHQDGGGKKEGGEFVDDSGGGVKDFDQFWKTISVGK